MSAVDAAYLAAQHIVVNGELVSEQRVIDKDGEHVLVLSRKSGPSQSKPAIPYRLFCSGGIDYSTVKVILREGGTKLTIRGELEMYQAGGKPALQGKKQYDEVLAQAANNAYKQHLDAVWARIRLVRK